MIRREWLAVAVSIGIGLLDWNLEHVCVARGRTLFLLKFSLRDDDDEFLYGDSQLKVSADLAVAAPAVPSSAGENNTSSPRTCILLRRVLYPTRLKRNINSTFLAYFFSFSLRARQLRPQRQHQLNRMSEFASATVFFQPSRAHPSHHFFFPSHV